MDELQIREAPESVSREHQKTSSSNEQYLLGDFNLSTHIFTGGMMPPFELLQHSIIECGDARDILRDYSDNHFTGLLSDPPYELGFMGRNWDKSRIVFGPELWAEVYRVMAPGSYLLAFGHSRTFYRLTCAIEDAGFQIRDHLLWLYGTGFPKSKATLKPSYEPIVFARKPVGRVKPLNISGCRVGIEMGESGRAGRGQNGGGLGVAGKGDRKHVFGRWPANILLDKEAAAALDEQSGERRTSKPGSVRRTKMPNNDIYNRGLGVLDRDEPAYGDTGGASRFFAKFKYASKASSKERNAGLAERNPHPCVKPLEVTKWLANLIKPEGEQRLLVPFSGSGSEMIAGLLAGWNEVTGIEEDPAYCRIAKCRIRHWVDKTAIIDEAERQKSPDSVIRAAQG